MSNTVPSANNGRAFVPKTGVVSQRYARPTVNKSSWKVFFPKYFQILEIINLNISKKATYIAGKKSQKTFRIC